MVTLYFNWLIIETLRQQEQSQCMRSHHSTSTSQEYNVSTNKFHMNQLNNFHHQLHLWHLSHIHNHSPCGCCDSYLRVGVWDFSGWYVRMLFIQLERSAFKADSILTYIIKSITALKKCKEGNNLWPQYMHWHQGILIKW